MKVYVTTRTSDNGEQFEEYREFTEVIDVYSSYEEAKKAIESLPTSIPCAYDEVYEYTEEHPFGIPKVDENGCIEFAPVNWSDAIYNIVERELKIS